MPVERDRTERAGPIDLHVDPFDAAPRVGRKSQRHGSDVMLAIDRDAPAARHEEQRKLLGEALEATMRGRHAARSEYQCTRLDFQHGGDLNRDNSFPERDGIHALCSQPQAMCQYIEAASVNYR